MKSKYRIFLNYIDHRGVNLIQRWLSHEVTNKRARIRINELIRTLEAIEKPQEQLMKYLKDDGTGLFELRVEVYDVRYRPIGFDGPGENEATLLIGAIHGRYGFEPDDAIEIALEMKKEVENDHERICICRHRFK